MSKNLNQYKNDFESILPLLKCPVSDNDLIYKDNLLTANKNKYPVINSIPWLIENPESSIEHWTTKKMELLHYYDNRLEKIKEKLAQPNLLKSTTLRLHKIESALMNNKKIISDLLKNLSFKSPEGTTLENKIPAHQSLSLYLKNIFRDWSWDTNENKISLEILLKVLPSSWQPENFLILGSGSSRLAMDIHQKFQLKCSHAIDINPLLFFVAYEMLSGRSLKLYDFPVAPISVSQIAVENSLANPVQGNFNNFHLIFADAQKLPIKDKVMDAALTPWLIDILPMNFNQVAQRVNRVLKIGGEWLNFGPLGFLFSDESICYSFEEIQELLKINGFKMDKNVIEQIPYLDCPYASQKRMEKVLCYRAIKVSDVKEEPYQYLPAWLMKHNEAIPINKMFQELQTSSKIQADISHSINGKISVNALTELMSQNYRIPKEEAKMIILSVLTKLFESKQRF